MKRAFLNYEKVKYYCYKKRLSLCSLANEVGICRQTIASWAKREVQAYKIWEIEKALGAERGEFILNLD